MLYLAKQYNQQQRKSRQSILEIQKNQQEANKNDQNQLNLPLNQGNNTNRKSQLTELREQLKMENPLYKQQMPNQKTAQNTNRNSTQRTTSEPNIQFFDYLSQKQQEKEYYENLKKQNKILYQGMTPHQIYDLKTREYMEERSLQTILDRQKQEELQKKQQIQEKKQLHQVQKGYQSETIQNTGMVHLSYKQSPNTIKKQKYKSQASLDQQNEEEKLKYQDQYWGYKTCFFHESSGQSWIPGSNFTLFDDEKLIKKNQKKAKNVDKHDLRKHLHGNVNFFVTQKKHLPKDQNKQNQDRNSNSPSKKHLQKFLKKKNLTTTNWNKKSQQGQTQSTKMGQSLQPLKHLSLTNYFQKQQDQQQIPENIQEKVQNTKLNTQGIQILNKGAYQYLAKPENVFQNLRKEIKTPQFSTKKQKESEEAHFFKNYQKNINKVQNFNIRSLEVENQQQTEQQDIQYFKNVLCSLQMSRPHTTLQNQQQQQMISPKSQFSKPATSPFNSQFFKTDNNFNNKESQIQFKSDSHLSPVQSPKEQFVNSRQKSSQQQRFFKTQNISQKYVQSIKQKQNSNLTNKTQQQSNNSKYKPIIYTEAQQKQLEQQEYQKQNPKDLKSSVNAMKQIQKQQIQYEEQQIAVDYLQLNQQNNITKDIIKVKQQNHIQPDKQLNVQFFQKQQKQEKMKKFFKNYKSILMAKFKQVLLQNEQIQIQVKNFLEIQNDTMFMHIENMYDHCLCQNEGVPLDFKYFSVPDKFIIEIVQVFKTFLETKEYLNYKRSSIDLIKDNKNNQNFQEEQFQDEQENSSTSYTYQELKQYMQQFQQIVYKELQPSNLLEKVGGFKQIKRIYNKFTEQIEQSQDKELDFDPKFLRDNFEDFCKIVSDYLKDTSSIPPDYLIQKFQELELQNLDFFIVKLNLWNILRGYSFPDDVMFSFFAKYEKLRYIVTQIGTSLDLRENPEILGHASIILKNSTFLAYWKEINNPLIYKISKNVLNFIYGFLDVDEFIIAMSQSMKKQMDLDFINNFETQFKEMLNIQYGLFKYLIGDFQDKIYILKVKLGIMGDFYEGINQRQIIQDLQKWIHLQGNKLSQDLMQLDVDKLDFLEFFLSFYLNSEQNFSFSDLSVARAYFFVPEKLVEFWFQGLFLVTSQQQHHILHHFQEVINKNK